MTGTLVDTSVLASALDTDSEWNEWSSGALLLASARGILVVNPIVYAELSAPFERIEDLDYALATPDVERRDLPWPAAFLAGKAFRAYRRRGGSRTAPIADFYIGAHAAVEKLDILTRDPRRIVAYFPTVRVISPQPDD